MMVPVKYAFLYKYCIMLAAFYVSTIRENVSHIYVGIKPRREYSGRRRRRNAMLRYKGIS